MRYRNQLFICALLLLAPSVVQAHGGSGKATTIYDGMVHLMLGVQYILPLAACALLASQKGKDILGYAQPLIALGVALGAGIALVGFSWEQVVYLNRFFMIFTGILVVFAFNLPLVPVLVVVFLGGALSGHELFVTQSPDKNPVLFCIGSMLGAMIIQGSFGALTLLSKAPWMRIAVRVVASWITAIGIIYTSFLFAYR